LTQNVGQIFFDGFYEMDAIQWHWIEALSRSIKDISFSLTDLTESRESLFEIPRNTRKKLNHLGFKSTALEQNPEDLKRFASPALSFLSRQLFQNKNEKYSGAVSEIEILLGMTPLGEIKMIASEIRKLLNAGVRPGEIMVIYRNLSARLNDLAQIFSQYQIPHEIHERLWFKNEPLLRKLKLFLDPLMQNPVYEGVFEYLKITAPDDFTLIEFVQFQKYFENKPALTDWATGFKYRDEKRYSEESFAALNHKLALTLRPLLEFHQKIQNARHAQECVQLIKDFLMEDIKTEELNQLKELDLLFKDIDFHFQQDHFSAADYLERLISAVEIHLISNKQNTYESVQIYTATLARQKEYPYVFLAGLVEKEFPQNHRESAVFRDVEINFLGWNLVSAEQKRLHEPYLFYLSATRAQKKLYLCHFERSSDYRPLLKSFYLQQLMDLFPQDSLNTKKQNLLEINAENAFLNAPSLAMHWMNVPVQPLSASLMKIVSEIAVLSQKDDIEVDFDRSQNILNYSAWSASALEKLNQCSYRFFGENILKIDQSSQFAEINKRTGEFLHEVLKEFLEQKMPLPALNEWQEALRNFVLSKKTQPQWLFLNGSDLTAALLWRKINKILDGILAMEYHALKTGALKPVFFEKDYEFQLQSPSLGALKFIGRIDRVDETAVGQYLIKDYKKSYRFKDKKIRTGQSLQLLFYVWLLAQNTPSAQILGAEIVNLEKQTLEGIYQNELPHELTERKNHLKNEKGLEAVLDDFQKHIFNLIQQFEEKPLAVNPQTCEFCQLRPLCRFENWRSTNTEELPEVIAL
jgi:ATP-dependent helicase/nuclease subunit B